MTLVSLVFISCILCFSCLITNLAAQNSIFREVVRQKTRGNKIQQCPCVLHPESKQCISYDSRYVAVSYEEAILSFRDLSNHNYPPSLVNSNTFNCQSSECRQCFSLLYNRLNEIGFIPQNYRSSITPLPQNQINPNLCPRYTFARRQVPPVPPPVAPPYVQSLISAGQRFQAANPPSSGSSRNQQNNQQGAPPAATPNISNPNNRNNQNQNQNGSGGNRNQNQNQNQNQNGNINGNSNNNNRNQNQNQNQLPNQGRFPNQNSGRNNNNQNFNQNFNRNQNQNQFFNRQQQQQLLQQQQFRNNFQNQNRFNPQQQFRPQQQQQQQQQQQFWQQPVQNFNQQQQQQAQSIWNGQLWQQVVNQPFQSSFNTGFNNGQNSNGNFPQVPVVVQPPPTATAPIPQPVVQPGIVPEWGGHWGLGSVGGGGQNGQNGQFNFFGLLGGRAKRKSKRATDEVVGQRFEINCIERGDAEDDMLALCGSCWTWRQLPENYFPRIINELSCKTDDFCLSGWGECVQQFRNVDVLRRENGRWIPTVITTATCCDCRVKAGTEIHSLVIGGKK